MLFFIVHSANPPPKCHFVGIWSAKLVLRSRGNGLEAGQGGGEVRDDLAGQDIGEGRFSRSSRDSSHRQ